MQYKIQKFHIMKLTGKKSFAMLINWLLFIVFIFFAVHLIYFLLGYSISLYKLKTGSDIFNDTFKIGVNAFGFDHKNSYQILYPLTQQNFMYGEFSLFSFLSSLFGFGGFAFYFFSLFQIFKNLSEDTIFNTSIIKWIKIFAWTNFTVAVLYLTFGFTYDLQKPSKIIFTSFPFLLISLISIFVSDFFKKGYELQSENDLTI